MEDNACMHAKIRLNVHIFLAFSGISFLDPVVTICFILLYILYDFHVSFKFDGN